MLKSVLCVVLTGLVCAAFEDNYAADYGVSDGRSSSAEYFRSADGLGILIFCMARVLASD